MRRGTIARPVHVAASPYKTGTTSLGRALVTLGVGREQMPYRPDLLRSHRETLRQFSRLAQKSESGDAFLEAHGAELRRTLRDFTRALAPYDIFPDAPFGHIHIHPLVKKALAPRARLIWIHRDFDEWIDSVRRWEEGHPEIYGDKIAQWAEDPDGRRTRMREFWIHHLRRFRKTARAFPGDCLELDLAQLDTMDALAAFYGLDAAGKPFPRRNVSKV
jgi:hypothetical protein